MFTLWINIIRKGIHPWRCCSRICSFNKCSDCLAEVIAARTLIIIIFIKTKMSHVVAQKGWRKEYWGLLFPSLETGRNLALAVHVKTKISASLCRLLLG